ncbi:MAG: putative Ig domain-containing protein [Burkholderiaceae bacterium]
MSTPTTNSVAVQPVAASADYRIASLVAGMRWGTEPGVTLAYSFASATSVWDSAADEYGLAGTGSEPYTGVAALTGPQKEAVRTALATWSNVANVKFGEVPDDATTVGELRFAWSALGGTTPTHAYAPSTVAKAADVWLNSSATWDAFWNAGSDAFLDLQRAIGIALGLKSPDAGAVVAPPSEQAYFYSVMNPGAFPLSLNSWVEFNPTTPMLYDVLAIQNMYGANTTWHTGDDTYEFVQGSAYFQTIWDAGGIDTIEWSASSQGALIDLRAGQFSEIGNPLKYWDADSLHSWTDKRTVAIAFGVTIENAIGGTGDDVIVGNDAINRLDGHGGADTITGGKGADVLVGGAGNDTFVCDSGTDLVTDLGYGADTLQVGGSAGVIATLVGDFKANAFTLNGGLAQLMTSGYSADLSRAAGPNGYTLNNGGVATAVALTGSAFDDVIYGGSGDDTLSGGSGDDEITGGGGSDRFVFTMSDHGTTVLTDFGLDDQLIVTGAAFKAPTAGNGASVALNEVQYAVVDGKLTAYLGLDATAGADEIIVFDHSAGQTTLSAAGSALSLGSNTPPVLVTPLPDRTVAEDSELSIVLPAQTFADNDAGDALTWSATTTRGDPLPEWLKFFSVTRSFLGTPTNGDVGTLGLRVTVSDRSGFSASDDFDVTITNTNDAPVVSIPLADRSTVEQWPFSFQLPASTFFDVDAGDAITWSASRADGTPLPAWMTFDAATRTLSGRSTHADVGTLALKATATDKSGAKVSDEFTLTIAPDHAPVLALRPPAGVGAVGATLTYTVPPGTFQDPDPGDDFTYSVSRADGSAPPSWLTANPAGTALTGEPVAGDAGAYLLRVTAADRAGLTASGDFFIVVSGGANSMAGTSASDTLTGSSSGDLLSGGGGDDLLFGAAGNDTIDGGTGRDTAIENGQRSEFRIEKTGLQWKVTDNAGNGGADTLSTVESLWFTDKRFELANLPRDAAPQSGIDDHFLFDGVYYLLSNPDLVPAQTLSSAWQHWVSSGAAAGDAPASWFDADAYSSHYADLAALHLDDVMLFRHFNKFGVWEGRSPGPAFDRFDGARYLAENPDVAAYVDAHLPDFLGSRTNGAIAHFLIYGAGEQRIAHDTTGGLIDLGYVV